jgi:hypothetical protein
VLAEGLAAAETTGAEHEHVRNQEDKLVIIYLTHNGAACSRNAFQARRHPATDGVVGTRCGGCGKCTEHRY